jgi:RecB family exonuclease
VCDRTERRGRTGRPAYWADERDRMRADLLEWLDHDSAVVVERGATVIASEERFDGAATMPLLDGRSIAINGSIDRVDRTFDGSLVVTDHKSGRNKYKDISADDPTVHGSLFQLPSYAAAARAIVGDPDAVVHAEYGLLRKGNYERPGVRIDETVDERVSEALSAVVAGIEAGWYPNRPERPGWRMYVNCEYCEPDHLGTAERFAEWDRKHHDPRLRPWFGDPSPPEDGEATP